MLSIVISQTYLKSYKSTIPSLFTYGTINIKGKFLQIYTCCSAQDNDRFLNLGWSQVVGGGDPESTPLLAFGFMPSQLDEKPVTTCTILLTVVTWELLPYGTLVVYLWNQIFIWSIRAT